MNVLAREGYLKEKPVLDKTKKRKRYTFGNKIYPYEPVLIKSSPETKPAPASAPEPKYPEIFYSEKELEEDINALIDNLENVKSLIPKVLAGLLDVTKAMVKFKKLKEILGDVADLASKNL